MLKNDAATTVILQNVKVIAYGKQLDPGTRVDPRDTSKPTVATLMVSQGQAEKLILAAQRGRLQLALRSALDDQVSEVSDAVHSSDLGIEEPQKPRPAAVTAPAFVAAPRTPPAVGKTDKPENDARPVVRIYRGEKVTKETFK